MKKRSQSGTTTVEFAIIGTVMMVIVFGIIEFGRALYTINVLTEAARRGARMAAVCPVGDPKPASVAIFDSGSGMSSQVPGLTTANVQIQYLDVNGTPVANPAANFGAIRYVQSSISTTSPYVMPLFIPILSPTLTLSGFTATMPRESLGISPAGVTTAC
jgi:Flp pilus assembly protein TadG